ncbi:hypothetical protein Pint_10785 [Pistacia integerrima]|uniref:Uncharacterized protein n=1 Tax=Pistacia integerrima TaxID=434235 RepID=A0ACC0XK95_9ROSI|nr:hypothetical protein Pint_10785 [Pistacia integerrima]
MAARPVLESGLMWRIGDGSKARIWQDKWLPSPSSFKIQSQCLGMDPKAKVATLIDPQSKSWKLDLLKDLFSESEVNTICQISISVFNRPDKLVWRCSQNGLFSVRSAYHLQVESQLSSQGQSSFVANENKKWKKLWKLPITNGEEDVLHALWGYAAAKDIWSSCSLTFQKMNDNFINFRELVMFFLSELEERHLAEFGVVVSKIWQRRNELTFKQHLSTPSQIIHHATQELDMLNSLHQSRTSPNAHPQIPDPSSPRWQSPPEGRFMATMRMKKPMFPDAYLAESFAALQADIGINQIILEGDALQVVNDLLRDEENWGQASLISMDTKAVSRNFQTFLVHHVNRASDVIAHTLAKDALNIDDVLVELEDVPNCIGSLVDPIE